MDDSDTRCTGVDFKCSDYTYHTITEPGTITCYLCDFMLGLGDNVFRVENRNICVSCCSKQHTLSCRETKGYENAAL